MYKALGVLRAATGLVDGRDVRIGKHVVVAGDGSAALNVACCAMRPGAQTINATSRRTPAEMDAFGKDKHQALDEGVQVNSRVRPPPLWASGAT